jgi:hypothetical protein
MKKIIIKIQDGADSEKKGELVGNKNLVRASDTGSFFTQW